MRGCLFEEMLGSLSPHHLEEKQTLVNQGKLVLLVAPDLLGVRLDNIRHSHFQAHIDY